MVESHGRMFGHVLVHIAEQSDFLRLNVVVILNQAAMASNFRKALQVSLCSITHRHQIISVTPIVS